jgi:hypothetical protein
MKKICKNCKWWKKEKYQIPSFDHRCSFTDIAGFPTYDFDKDDCMNSYELIGTGPNFGCIHFEEKEDL